MPQTVSILPRFTPGAWLLGGLRSVRRAGGCEENAALLGGAANG
jgi:hypothetical protein